ncbi:hypothetical protein GCM10009679_03300 [Saccharothrix algeriensis]
MRACAAARAVPDKLIVMTWSWRYEDAEGKPVEGPNETFSNQADAESWLGQTWRDLVAAGTAEVVLVEGDRDEYRMSLQGA